MIVRESLEFQRGLATKDALTIGEKATTKYKIENDEDFLDDFITDLATDNGFGWMQAYLSTAAQKSLAIDILIKGREIKEDRLWIDEMGKEVGIDPIENRDGVIKAFTKKYLDPQFAQGWELFHDTDQDDFIEYILIR